MRTNLKFIIVMLFIILIPIVYAGDYSYQNSEQLKPLIQWHEYTKETFTQAATENKPIFLLLTAPTWCYWCQVYESEDYLFNPQIVKYINENFVAIYVDADKRQDLTRQYLEGGWPSTTLLTPYGKRINGFSGPRPPNIMISTMQQAVLFTKSNGTRTSFIYNYNPSIVHIPSLQELVNLNNGYLNYAVQLYDPEYGGFGDGQKFPQARTLDYLLDEYALTNNDDYILVVQNTLNNEYTNISEIQINYNLFDPVEGGFHRYGTKRDYTPPTL